LKNLNLGVDQNVVRVGLTVPVDEVRKAVQSAMNSQMKKPAPIAAARRPVDAVPTIQQSPAPHEVVPALPIEAVAAQPAPAPVAAARKPPQPPASAARSPRIPANAELLIQSSPKDMGTVVILGSKK